MRNVVETSPPGPEGGGWRRYRCPVCGHTDAVTLSAAGPTELQCTHCNSPLLAEARPGGTARVEEWVAVRVARETEH